MSYKYSINGEEVELKTKEEVKELFDRRIKSRQLALRKMLERYNENKTTLKENDLWNIVGMQEHLAEFKNYDYLYMMNSELAITTLAAEELMLQYNELLKTCKQKSHVSTIRRKIREYANSRFYSLENIMANGYIPENEKLKLKRKGLI